MIGIEQESVRKFMVKAEQEYSYLPTDITDKVKFLRIKLINEELIELIEAMFTRDLRYNKIDLVEVADAIGDLLVVVLGTAVAFGIDIEPVFNEIMRSNMTKFIDGHKRDDGKWVKGPSYEPANLKSIIENQQK